MLDKQIDQSVKTEWSRLKQSSAADTPWHCRATPIFPAEWPVDNGSLLVAYGYLYKLPPRSGDAEQQTGPYCQVLIAPNEPNEPKSNELAYDLQNAEMQGVRPIVGAEKEVADTGKAVQSLLLDISLGQAASAVDLQFIKRYYLFWRSCNGVIAARIAPYHKEFFVWLDSKQDATSPFQ
jgi:hypothetical protein